MIVRTVLLACLALIVCPARAQKAPPDVQAAMKEMWRRGNCLLSSVHRPAARESAVPRDVGSVPVVTPHVIARTGAILCYAVDGSTVWAADDRNLHRVDAATGRAKRYGPAEGLPEAPVQSIAPAGGDVWLATRAGLAVLRAGSQRIQPVGGVEVRLGRLAAGASGVWLVGDAGAYHLPPGQRTWRKLPEFPAQEALAQVVHRGFWSHWWPRRVAALIPSIFANADGLYVIVLNRLLRYDPSAGAWRQLGEQAWEARADGRTVWALVTGGVLRYDPAGGKTQRFAAGKGPAAGRPAAMALGGGALFVASEPDYDAKARRFVGGGLSRMDLAAGTWTVTETIGGSDVRFAAALTAEGDEAWAACLLYDGVRQLGAHPGMAHVKRWRPVVEGVGLLHYSGGRWNLLACGEPEDERRWVMGQKGTVHLGRILPRRIERLCLCRDCLWGIYRMFPEEWYAGYFVSAGRMAARSGDRWEGDLDVRTEELGLAGEFPDLMLISHSHGERIVLAEGHPIVLGIESVAGRPVAVCESGVFLGDPAGRKFAPAVRTGPRLYWRATAAAAGRDAVWFGGDAGTVTRLDRRSGRIELLGVAVDRKVVAMAAADGRLRVRTAEAKVVLPVCLRSAPKLPDGEVLIFDGKQWSAGGGAVEPDNTPYSVRHRSNYLYRGEQRVAFLKGVFRPKVLCADPVGGRLWLGTHDGVAAVPLAKETGE